MYQCKLKTNLLILIINIAEAIASNNPITITATPLHKMTLGTVVDNCFNCMACTWLYPYHVMKAPKPRNDNIQINIVKYVMTPAKILINNKVANPRMIAIKRAATSTFQPNSIFEDLNMNVHQKAH